jgi:hypothetical protein
MKENRKSKIRNSKQRNDSSPSQPLLPLRLERGVSVSEHTKTGEALYGIAEGNFMLRI